MGHHDSRIKSSIYVPTVSCSRQADRDAGAQLTFCNVHSSFRRMCNLYRMTKSAAEVARWFNLPDETQGANAGEEVYPG